MNLPNAAIFLLASLIVFIASSSFAQTSRIVKDAPKVQKAEKIKITGSRIKRTDWEGISPVHVIDQSTIQDSGVSTVAEILQQQTIASSGSYSSTSVMSDTRRTVHSANLKGLGADNTLVLLDGHRLSDDGGEGIVDISLIPLAAVERIEVLKDSASALYGSDALGGVVNIITKKDYEGVTTQASSRLPRNKGGQAMEFSITQGISRKQFQNLTVLSYRHQEPVWRIHRPWTKEVLSIVSRPANYRFLPDGRWRSHPNCPADNPKQGEFCTFNWSPGTQITPESRNLSVFNSTRFQLTPKVSAQVSLNASQHHNMWQMAPNAGILTIPQEVAEEHKQYLGLREDVSGDLDILLRTDAWGPRVWDSEKTTMAGTMGLEGMVNVDWDWQFSATVQKSRRNLRNPEGFSLESSLINGIERREFNPFLDENLTMASPSFVAESSYEPFVVRESGMNTYNFNVSGEWGQIPGGDLGVALGVQRQEQSYKKEYDDQWGQDPNNVFGKNPQSGSEGKRVIHAIFGELMVPVVQSLEIQLALRHDVYDDFGETTNPKVGFKYLPHKKIMIRGSGGTGFKAPTLSQINKGQTTVFQNLYDRPACAEAPDEPCSQTTEVMVTTQGNKDLREERSIGYSAGIVAEPHRKWSFAIDYWYIKIKDIAREIEAQEALDSLAAGKSNDDITVVREGGRLMEITVPTLNLGISEDSGVDVHHKFKTNLDGWGLGFEQSYSRKFFAKKVKFPGAAQRDTLGERGKPRWRAVSSLTIKPQRSHSFLVRQNLIGTQGTLARTEGQQRLDRYLTYDLMYSWQTSYDGRLTLGALNAFNKPFPRDTTGRPGDKDTRVHELFSPDDGIAYFAGVEQRF